MTLSTWKRFTPLILVVGDVLALLLFVYVGQRDHEVVDPANPLLGVALTALPFAATWLVAGALLDAYPAMVQPSTLLARTALVWLIATPLGVTLRALISNRSIIPTSFMLATYAFVGLFLIGWRAVFVLLVRIRQRT